MPGPLSGVKFIHNAFRNDLQRLRSDIQFWATLGDGDVDLMERNFAYLHESLALHEMAEEAVLFPAVNAIDAGRADVYIQTHRQIDVLRDGLLEALRAKNADKSFDLIMELKPLMDAHLTQEESELLAWADEKISFPDQGRLAGEMAGKIPPEKMGAMVPWMVRLLSTDDREGVMRMWAVALPAPAFAGIKKLVEGALKPNEWSDLVGRMPGLAS
jgi:hemerythrin superfamily protein